MGLDGLRAALGERAREDELLSKHTTFGIGGPADLFVTARLLSELRATIRLAWDHNVAYFVLGSGANILVADTGIRGLVIKNLCAQMVISPGDAGEGWTFEAESGAEIKAAARSTIERGLAGLEWAVDVPGTVGGAVVGNAGAFGGYIADNLRNVLVLSREEGESWWLSQRLGLGYRTSMLKRAEKKVDFLPVILAATFELRYEGPASVRERAAEYTRRRTEMQPSGPSAGSIFKRTEQYPAGFLIENAGLKGTRIGGAIVSPQHANFILNTGTATAQDVRDLINLIRQSVQRKFGILLEPEIEFVGDWQSAAEGELGNR
jgi:UDP-N-acetylmuramate dehydrogenase